MAIKKGDFIEIEFTGKIKDGGEVFDTNVKRVAEENNFEIKNIKPFILAIGQKMLPKGFDEDLEGKEAGKEYTLELKPEEAFGKRNREMIKMIPTKRFLEQRINPERGMQLSLDGQLVKVLSNSGGRTLVDFNNPLAGKEVIYEYKILREVKDQKEKIDGLQDFLFKKVFDFEIKNQKIIFKVEKQFEPFVKVFSSKFKEVLGLEVNAEIIEKKKEKQKKEKNNST